MALTGQPYAYAANDPINNTDPLGLWPWDGICVQNPFGDDDSCDSIAEQHPEVTQQVVDFAGGVLDVNPITAPLPLDLEGHGVNTSSGAFTLGQGSMFAFETGFGFASASSAAFNTTSSGFFAASVCSGTRQGSCADAVLALFASGTGQVLGFGTGLNFLGHEMNAFSNFIAAFAPTTWGRSDC